MARAAAEPTVPGATGAYPHPNQVATCSANLFDTVVFTAGFRLGRVAWDHVLLRGPVAEIDQAASFAAKRKIRIARLHFLFADRAFHKEMLISSDSRRA